MKGRTLVESILSEKIGREVEVGEIIKVNVDVLMVNEVTGPLAFETFEKIGGGEVWNPDSTVLVLDHDIPPSDIKSARMIKRMREFAYKYSIKNFYEIGRGGICHQILYEEGFNIPGHIIVGADSHTCTSGATGALGIGVGSTDAGVILATGKIWLRVPESIKISVKGEMKKWITPKDIILTIIGEVGADGALYKAVEYHGETIRKMSLSGRLTICNMSVEMGAKTGIIPPDEKAIKYAEKQGYRVSSMDLKDAKYVEEYEFYADEVEPVVSIHPRVDNVKPARELENIEIDQAVIGSCTNGRIEDLRIAAEVVKNKKINSRVRLIVTPASMKVYRKALKEGLLEIFIDAGGIVTCPTCGVCLGMSHGVLSEGEVAIATTNRNFIGRMGHKDSKVYLASPATVAASALTGRITDPRDVI
ncbi:3-isopropylmalate dehydratase large subunit [Candidatus Bathyarchaeota archaeon ex4484_205]|nr:MAG: 3-isopropylmalate dehydratase large subunit [Candidatus Bathyarchaeota archaeon ex4484_205]